MLRAADCEGGLFTEALLTDDIPGPERASFGELRGDTFVATIRDVGLLETSGVLIVPITDLVGLRSPRETCVCSATATAALSTAFEALPSS